MSEYQLGVLIIIATVLTVTGLTYIMTLDDDPLEFGEHLFMFFILGIVFVLPLGIAMDWAVAPTLSEFGIDLFVVEDGEKTLGGLALLVLVGKGIIIYYVSYIAGRSMQKVN